MNVRASWANVVLASSPALPRALASCLALLGSSPRTIPAFASTASLRAIFGVILVVGPIVQVRRLPSELR